MPNRIIRDGILSSEAVCSLAWPEEVFYRRLMSVADDHGRFHTSPKLLRAACYPLQHDKVSDSDIGKWITACVTAGLVRVYPAPDGKRYLEIVKFGQQVRSKSRFPGAIPDSREQLIATDINGEQPLANEHLGVCVVVDEGGIAAPQPDEPLKGLDAKLVRDFKAIRKAKKAPITETAMDGIRREADKAGLTFEAAIRVCCERGWSGFKSEWYSNQGKSGFGPPEPAPRVRKELPQ